MASANTTSVKAGKTAAKRAATSARRSAGASKAQTSRTAAVKTSYAERAVLIPVGAALVARDRIVAGVNDTISSYSSPSKAQAQLRKFERRGNTARKRLEREARKARVRVERELRQRRRDGAELADRVQERIVSLV